MSRLIRASTMLGCPVHARDGELGHLSEFSFDDATWQIRYLVVDVENSTMHKRVLLAPHVVDHIDEHDRFLHVSVTCAQVQASPRIDTDKPISLQHLAKLHGHYGWGVYWRTEVPLGRRTLEQPLLREPVNAGGKQFDPHLRTTGIVTGHAVQATDGVAGMVAGFVLDVADWTIRSLTVSLAGGETRSLRPGLVLGIDFEKSLVVVNMTGEQIRSLPE